MMERSSNRNSIIKNDENTTKIGPQIPLVNCKSRTIDSGRTDNFLTNLDRANWLSYSTFSWVLPFLFKIKSERTESGVPFTVPLFDSIDVNVQRLEILWKNELRNNANNPSLLKCVITFLKSRLILSCFVFAFCLIFGFIGPTCFVRSIIHFAEEPTSLPDGNINYRAGFIFVGLLFAVEVARVISYGATWAISYRTGIRVRGAVLGLLYKTLLNVRSMKGKTASEIVNIYANDGQRIFDAVTFAPLVLIGPTVLFGGMAYLWYKVGWLSLLGIFVFLLCDALQAVLGITMVRFRALAIKTTEKRMSVMGEIIRCIRVIKMNAWEDLFIDKIEALRKEEQKYLKTAGYAQSFAIAFGTIVPVLAMIVTVLAIVIKGQDFAASDAFSMITVYFVMLFGIRMIPYGARYLSESVVAMRRIQAILQFPSTFEIENMPRNPGVAISLNDASFEYDKIYVEPSTRKDKKGNEEVEELKSKEDNENCGFTLSKLKLTVKKQELIGICGPLGSGKSSLLTALNGHMDNISGEYRINGSIAFVGKDPCIQTTTIRNNIIFGQPFNTSLYNKVLDVTELSEDIGRFPAKDFTELGERGTTLSGGQRARIALARALYANKDIYLLDDIFSALDCVVAEKIFKKAIIGMLQYKTIILVTSNPEYLAKCGRVIYMDSGKIIENGSHEDLLETSDFYKNFFSSLNIKKDYVDEASKEIILESDDSKYDKSFYTPEKDGKVIDEEEDYGLQGISCKIYHEYIIAAGGYIILTILLFTFIINVGATIFSTFWLTKWMKSSHEYVNVTSNGTIFKQHLSLADNEYTTYYATIYAISLVFLFFSALIKAMVFVKVSLKASTNLHNKMLYSVLHAMVSFYDSTPVGRILNRFSKDVDEVDVKLPFSSEAFLQNMITCIGFMAVIAWVFPLFILFCIPIMILFAIFFSLFQSGIRSLKRTENLSRSPLYDHITASIEGFSTIRCYRQTENFIKKFNQKFDENSGAVLMFQSATRWQAVWLDILVVLITTCVAVFIIWLTGVVNPAEAGMALAFAIQMSGIFQFAVRSQTELEAKLTSVERISYYFNSITQETRSNTRNVPQSWPTKGDIIFENLRMRYRINMNLALDDVSLHIEPNEKIGIVGRTGAGKSSVCNALLQLYPLQNGRIIIDSIDISDVDLKRLRSSLAVIPQEPVLFAETVRFNLDPKGNYSDNDIWDALEKTNMKTVVSNLPQGLDFMIEENGSNFSSGEKQLLCLARAILRKCKIVILDEPTACLDEQTDLVVQECVNSSFQNCTLLLIAHRLGSVLNMDKILYMGDGKIIEFNKTKTLIKDKNSQFRAILSGTNLVIDSENDT
ncbi:Canalicular multispecific organic anion transporter 1 [Strongyloides ratti]|uniref:Canalicular multispecific organic anion transporter 1 n=1 Tax=Strongyloides ratti TaxID=34506 RepID=A0A090MZY5_STRRB|nr:Canalicular multispecific organic anion transporter 1 [Strongyloides ratti]CEF69745.1 Canalicular multispecific organic anion transporter 1 [Strongyloides ratti]